MVAHCDQVPVWLRVGARKQLYTRHEVRQRKAHKGHVPGGHDLGGQVIRDEEEDGAASSDHMRQTCVSEGDRFKVTLELSQ